MRNWGSSQYGGIATYYKGFFSYLEEGLSVEEAFGKLYFDSPKVTPKKFEDVKKEILPPIIKDELDMLMEDVDCQDWEGVEHKAKMIAKLARAKSIDDVLKAQRALSWDLWGAVSTIARSAFGLEVDDDEDAAVACILLTLHYGVKESSFKGFAT